ncbi:MULTISPECIES: transporter substrate-binding domain-containing protein [Cupriavidus]|uniref:Amino acid ABC transporter substrate-binding protein, PAAT family n=1 Tax=Cupriavidus pinatubonensis (strain JMP 134 / LMG 1197) TaxID=264198 RepID=Q473C8_CUPPJ|nr:MULTISPECIES: transporter substrate-binding domain-containing protein [Cupriavidus]QYY32693.1 transporter substrate-binding domain-containing protein [Cupriavidus pinatubonensis]TPQ43400.1 amino acid ABC transporter substrate-binding protein [Cupriavidus pinatubonensis]
MKSIPVVAAVLIAAGLPLGASDVYAQTLEKIASSDKITVSYREAAVPFSYLLAPHKAVGFSVDLTEAIIDDVRSRLKKPNLKVDYVPVTGQNRIPMLVSGTYDLECGSTTNTSARGKEVAFSINVFYAGTRLLTKKNSGIKNYSDLTKKTVASTAGSTNEKLLSQYSADHNLDIQLISGKDYADAMQLVLNDRAVALALDDVLLFGLRANSRSPSALEIVGDTLQVEPYACMVRKDDTEFKKLVDGTITRLMKSGEFTRLYKKWFESPIPPAGANLNMPMSDALRANIKIRSDKPAQ